MSLIETSRFISLVLRHKPSAAGITLDCHGWADVNELIAGVAKRHPIDMRLLEEIVENDGKGRYSFSEDKTKIRANQGHSVDVDVELEELTPPDVLYHGTAEKYIGSILKSGLVPKSRLYVHLSRDTETAIKVGKRHGTPVVLAIDAKAMSEDGAVFYISKNGVLLTKEVPPRYLKPISTEK